MERMTESEILEVVQAYMDGKEIERSSIYRDKSSWKDKHGNLWDFAGYRYRVKRQPRVIWVNDYPNTGLSGATCFEDKNELRHLAYCRPVKFIEVLDD